MVLITRRADFCASHICARPDVSPEENRRIYGDESAKHGHGHNYRLEVSVAGEVDPVTGMILDLKDLKEILQEEVVEVYDHRFLNHEVEPFDRVVPTVENLARDVWRRIEPRINRQGRRLHMVRLYETPDLFVEITEP